MRKVLGRCKVFYGYLLKTLHLGNKIYVYSIDFKVFLCFSADPNPNIPGSIILITFKPLR